jgi:5-methylcytosine-specific restriction endonuclease McrA
MTVPCAVCLKPFKVRPAAVLRGRKHCSRQCSASVQRNMRGPLARAWKGGVPDCSQCGKRLARRENKSGLCRACVPPNRPSLGKRRSLEIIEKIRRNRRGKAAGPSNHSWKGGISLNPDYRRFIENRRRVAKRQNGGTHSYADWEALKRRFNYTCLSCRRREPAITLSQDHVIPISRGGSDDISNIQPLCRRCNFVKQARTIDYRLTTKIWHFN